MRTSLNQIKLIEAQLSGSLTAEDALLCEAHALLDPEWNDKIAQQQQAQRLVLLYGRQQLRSTIQAVHDELFSRPEHRSFREKVMRLFYKT